MYILFKISNTLYPITHVERIQAKIWHDVYNNMNVPGHICAMKIICKFNEQQDSHEVWYVEPHKKHIHMSSLLSFTPSIE